MEETVADLTRRQIALRDGLELGSGHARERRLERIEKLERGIIEVQAFIEDLDRYATHAAQAVLVGTIVAPFMGRMVKNLRAEAVARGQAMQRERHLLQETL